MAVLTAFRRKRIRRADAGDISRISNQDNYWSTDALREILERIELLNTEDPSEALAACRAILKVPERVRGISPDLKALTLAVYGSTLRHNRDLEQALAVYEQALAVEGISVSGRGDVLARMAVTLVHLGRLDEGLATVDKALQLVVDPVPALVVRGWIRMFTNPLNDALDDFMAVLEHARNESRSDYSLFCAIVNSCNLLSYETLTVDEALVEKVRAEIRAYRAIFPDGGSGYRKAQRPRLILSRAEALILMRTQQSEKALRPLQRAADGLKAEYPDDALDAHADLMCLLSKLGMEEAAARIAASAVELLSRVTYRVHPMGRNALLTVAKKEKVSFGEAVEVRILLRPREL